ncbi:MAG: ORF6N domain-containing protein [Moraxella osloensis]|nr:ORF6N domain-containing protein [Moraxella osloensis]
MTLLETLDENTIKSKIYTLRNVQVMLDRDLAELYGVETKRLNEQVKRNIARFPESFRFQLTKDEFENWKSQIATSNSDKMGLRRAPYAFTEQGVAMLSAVLNSTTAIEVSIKIIEAFVEMKRFINANQSLLERMVSLEFAHHHLESKTNQNFEKIFAAIEANQLPKQQGIFFEGQIFDAYVLVSDLIKQAKDRINLIDNYIDESVLLILAKRNKNVKAEIFTKTLSPNFLLDIKKHNQQYPAIQAYEFTQAHDRFLIIDQEVYHLGASLKDLGRKWFAFSKMHIQTIAMLEKLEAARMQGGNNG